jgi:hypothetical protein
MNAEMTVIARRIATRRSALLEKFQSIFRNMTVCLLSRVLDDGHPESV